MFVVFFLLLSLNFPSDIVTFSFTCFLIMTFFNWEVWNCNFKIKYLSRITQKNHLYKSEKEKHTEISGLMFSNECKMFLDEFNSIPEHCLKLACLGHLFLIYPYSLSKPTSVCNISLPCISLTVMTPLIEMAECLREFTLELICEFTLAISLALYLFIWIKTVAFLYPNSQFDSKYAFHTPRSCLLFIQS